MHRRSKQTVEVKYEERWTQIEAKLKEYKELISSINRPLPLKGSSSTKMRSSSRPARAPSVPRGPQALWRDRSKDPTFRTRGPSVTRTKSPLARPHQMTLSVSGVSCMRSRNGALSSRSSMSSVASSTSLPKLQPIRSLKVSTSQVTEANPLVATRSSRECQTTPPPEVHAPLCSLSPLVVAEESNALKVDETQIKLINLELRELLLSP